MEIVYLGHASFKISSKTTVLVTDPYDPQVVGLPFPKLERVDIVTVSHDHGDHNATTQLPSGAFKIAGPGEYEKGGVFVRGVATFHDNKEGAERGRNTVYVITLDGINICYLGDLGHKLSEEQMTQVGTVDILFVPVGGFYTINADTASEVVLQLEPKIVIPMHFNTPKLNQEVFGKLDTADKFLKKMGAEGLTAQSKLVTSKEKLPETTTVVLLES